MDRHNRLTAQDAGGGYIDQSNECYRKEYKIENLANTMGVAFVKKAIIQGGIEL